MLSHVADFNFNWHNSYVYADDAAPLLPKGTIIKVTAWHDNTAANKNNPDPNVWVGYGDRTVDEMAHAWVNVTYMGDDDYKAEARDAQGVSSRRRTRSSNSSSKSSRGPDPRVRPDQARRRGAVRSTWGGAFFPRHQESHSMKSSSVRRRGPGGCDRCG